MHLSTKTILLISGVTILIMIGFFAYSYYSRQQISKNDKAHITAVSQNFSNAWFNYKIQTDPVYLQTIKPFMTDEFYKETSYVNTSRPQDFVDQPPMDSKILSVSLVEYSDKAAKTEVLIESNEAGVNTQKIVVYLTLLKTSQGWLVSNMDQTNN